MPEHTRHRDRRLRGAAIAAVVLTGLGGGLTAYGLSQQETRMPPPAAISGGGHAGHSGNAHAAHHGTTATPSPTSDGRSPDARPLRMTRSTPTSVSIPSLGITSEVIELGVQLDATMEVPHDGTSTGWFTGGPTPGELGPSIMAAHVTWDEKPAVFFELSAMREGQRVEVDREDGSTAVFEVTDVGQYPKADFPTDEVYGEVDHAALRLITCGGYFDGETGHHVDNVVVYAELVDERPAG